jgi:hypothetical protein
MGTVYLQFDSQSRSNPYIIKTIQDPIQVPAPVPPLPPLLLNNPPYGTNTPLLPGSYQCWVPNDNYNNSLDTSATGPPMFPYQTNRDLVQSPTNYRVFYKELNTLDNIRTTSFLEHCKERPTNIVFSVESCVASLPSSAVVPRIDPISGLITYNSVLNEPYIYARVMPIENSEGNLITSNNLNADKATFVLWHDRVQFGQQNQPATYSPPRPYQQQQITPPSVPPPYPPNTVLPTPPLYRNPLTNTTTVPGPLPPAPIAPTPAWPARPAADVDNVLTTLSSARWLIYKTCMATTMQLNLASEEWQIRFFDRNGNDIIVGEPDLFSISPVKNVGFAIANYGTDPNATTAPPGINPDVQTNILMGIRPIYT